MSQFESLKRIDENGEEYWSARDLMPALGYEKWQNFQKILEKAELSIQTTTQNKDYHFTDASKMIELGKTALREIVDYKLTRYECYIVAQCGDPSKEQVALAQTYFAQKTRQQEIAEQFNQLTEEEKRLAIRSELKGHNKSLNDAAHSAGITTGREYAAFHNAGYRGLYNGLTENDIHRRKGLAPSEKILDHMGSTELAANLFRATQTDEKLRREKVRNPKAANALHYKVGAVVRATIKELGGTMPEDLPTPDKSIRQLEQERKKALKKK